MSTHLYLVSLSFCGHLTPALLVLLSWDHTIHIYSLGFGWSSQWLPKKNRFRMIQMACGRAMWLTWLQLPCQRLQQLPTSTIALSQVAFLQRKQNMLIVDPRCRSEWSEDPTPGIDLNRQVNLLRWQVRQQQIQKCLRIWTTQNISKYILRHRLASLSVAMSELFLSYIVLFLKYRKLCLKYIKLFIKHTAKTAKSMI